MKNRMLMALGVLAAAMVFLGCHHRMNAEPREIAIEVTVPDPAWTVTIDEVYATAERLLVISSLKRDPELMAPQVISQARDSVKISAPDLPVEHYVLGKTFRWAEEPHYFVRDRKEVEPKLKDARLLYRRPDRAGDPGGR